MFAFKFVLLINKKDKDNVLCCSTRDYRDGDMEIWSLRGVGEVDGLLHPLTFWRRNYFFFNFSTPCIKNVNNTGTKYVRIMKQTAF